MTTQHTPGPWEVEIADSLYNTFYIVNEDRESDELDHANARLIAAAPELLAALREVLLHSEEDSELRFSVLLDKQAIDIVNAAIAKATNH